MHAILYVAGRAHRLGALAAKRNKVLFEFKGQSLLERHVMILEKIGVPKLYVVTGHMRENLQAEFPILESRYKVKIEELYNPDYTEGSALSMHASLPALENVTDNILIMDGDVLYDVRMMRQLLDSPHRSALLVDRNYSTIDDDPVLVPMKKGIPFDFIKKWKGDAETIGESIGFFKIHPSDLPMLVRETKARKTGPGRNDSYDDILRVLVQAGVFGAVDVTGLPWTEIDFPHDLDYAAKLIVPLLQDA